jgi:putative aminopeptidase FrvX
MSCEHKPWTEPMPEDQFARMRDILAAPSPVGLEGAMTHGLLQPAIEALMPESWKIHRFRGNASIVVDTAPDRPEAFTVMVIGHADKIRLQVRSIGADGKIWVNSDSFLPTTLVGHEVRLFSEDPEAPGSYRVLRGGTVEAIGAIHFADPAMRDGRKGLEAKKLYLELQLHGKNRKKQVESLGIRAGDSILLDRPIRHGFAPDTFQGAYLDNGLGCFVVFELARLLAERGLDNVRFLGAAASHEEIGRQGSRVLAGELRPDVVIAVDVNHDYESAPGIKDRRFEPLTMGGGFTLSVGAIASAGLNAIIQRVAREHDIPLQLSLVGRDTGTDAMAAVLASLDAAATSIGFPIRNMHTISESGHTGDVLAALHGIYETLRALDAMNDGAGIGPDDLRDAHPRLDLASPLVHQPLEADGDEESEG